MSKATTVLHPGLRIKSEVIPPKMSVTKAAELIGVGRPALSNLLNGKAALSSEMAARLEKAFKVPLQDLLEMQARYDAAQAEHKVAPPEIKSYVPPFLSITANLIERWASSNIRARSRFAVFLRTLVHSTGTELKKVDFPGNDDAEKPGWDGYIDAGVGTPWIPAGISGWEFGTNEDPRKKADGDFEKSVKATAELERERMSFIFVTPRRWPGKSGWVEAKKAERLWFDVRAYDASDLEQWVEQSLPGQAWFANETHIPAQHVRSLDRCWEEWAHVAPTPLSGELFNSAIESAKRTVLSRLSKPAEAPILIAADSTGEALAFVAQLLGPRGGAELMAYRDRVLVFDELGVLPRLAAGAQSFIPVTSNREVERELGPFSKSMHAFVIYPRNAAAITPDVVLEPVASDTFSKALEEMGQPRDEISRLAKASGRSLTVLRRQMCSIPAIRTPEWAADHRTAVALVPFLLVGAWNSQNETDKVGLSLIAGDISFDELEQECQRLAQLNDAPLWSVGAYRGVTSKIDLLYAIAAAVTRADLDRYFSIAKLVLGEDDPALDLDEGQRWAAAIHGKVREFSPAFREGISETLVLLAVHGESLFKKRLGVDTEVEVVRVVRESLLPLTTRVLEANNRDLPTYAEACPDEFLSIIEQDLKSPNPAVLGLLRPVDSGVFGSSPARSGLLWALEGLSWNPETLPRAALILARLAQVEINDNWTNKPANSLDSIFRAWMPQTAADLRQRIDLMKKLSGTFPDVAWKICLAQFNSYDRIGHYSHKPRWRPDGYGFGEPLPTWGPINSFVHEMVEMALSWKEYTLEMLCDLVERIPNLSTEHQGRAWELVLSWASSKASDSEKAVVREKIRVSTLSRKALLRAENKDMASAMIEKGQAAYDALAPEDLIHKHLWLFRDSWIEFSADELDESHQLDFQKRDEQITKVRTEAVLEIFEAKGVRGLLELARLGRAAWVVGAISSTAVPEKELLSLLRLALTAVIAREYEVHAYKNIIAGAVRAVVDPEKRNELLLAVGSNSSEDDVVELLLLAPFGKNTWTLVDALQEEAQTKYWKEVIPDWLHNSEVENVEAVERLLHVERPRAAFSCIKYKPDQVDALLVARVLRAMAEGGKEAQGQYPLEHYHVQSAFDYVNRSSALTLEEKAGLEFAYIDVLSRPSGRRNEPKIPNLERYVESHPELFTQAVCWTYKRSDGASDPVPYSVPPEKKKVMAERGYTFLDALRRIPGHNRLDELDAEHLGKWISEVRKANDELSRGEIGDVCLGKLLSHSPIGLDQVWPCEVVRDVMEEIQSEAMMSGASTGVYNSRGVVWRGEGGDQERELAEKYRHWARALQVSHPFVASKLLMALAKTYEREANREDTEAVIRRRLG